MEHVEEEKHHMSLGRRMIAGLELTWIYIHAVFAIVTCKENWRTTNLMTLNMMVKYVMSDSACVPASSLRE